MKVFRSFALTAVLIAFLSQAAFAMVKTGDYVSFGSYLDEPIIWQVIQENNGELMLWSERIITVKPFDALGDMVDGRGSDERIRVGANFWAGSSLREWLNSEDETVSFTYNPPSKEYLWNGLNSYADEAGFLSNFSETERLLIKPVENKTLLSTFDAEVGDGGSEVYSFQGSQDLKKSLMNYESAYYQVTTDRVFILDIKELAELVSANGFSRKKLPTDASVLQSEYKSPNLRNTATFNYWTRTPVASTSDKMVRISNAGVSGDTAVDNRCLGVIPALVLNSTYTIESGDGTADAPYVIR